MELIDYVHILRRRWVLIALVMVACVGGAAAATKLTTPTYQATSRLIVNGSSTSGGVAEIVTEQLASARASSLAEIIPTTPAVQAALTKAEKQAGPFSISGGPSVSASADGTTPFINITVSDTDPRRAAAVANAMTSVLPSVINELKQPATSPHEIVTLNSATVPSKPSSPKPKENLIIGLALGLVLGCGAALVVESLDRRLKDSADVEKASGLTALGIVPLWMPNEPVPTENFPRSTRAEAYRKVRTNLAFVSEHGPPKSIVITSAASSEGKTSLAVNLAVASARTGQKVVLVDADLRRPMVQSYLDSPAHLGLVDVLAGTVELKDALQFSEVGRMDVLVSGPVPTNPNELLGSDTMRRTIRQLEADYDIVIIDTPPVLPVADALSLAVIVDAVVIVARLGQTTRDRLRRTNEALANVHANVVGVVPNGAVEKEDSAYYYAYRYRSRHQPLDVPYEAYSPQVNPQPKGMRPADRSNGKSHDNGNAVDTEASLGRRGKHFARRGRSETDTETAPPEL